MTTVEKIQTLLQKLNTEELKGFVSNNCPDSIIGYALNELETRMSEEEFIQFANEF